MNLSKNKLKKILTKSNHNKNTITEFYEFFKDVFILFVNIILKLIF